MKRANRYPLGDRKVVTAALICLAGFGGFLAWAGLARLDEGVTAAGSIVVEDRRQVVQHLEGGVVTRVAVAEGYFVRRGQVLLTLSSASSGSERDQVLAQLGYLEATIARLSALSKGNEDIDFANVRALGLSADMLAEIQSKEHDLFEQARDALAADAAILAARRSSALATGEARLRQVDAARRGMQATSRQLSSARDLLAKRMARLDQVETLERSVADLEADIARLDSERREAIASAADYGAQIEKARIEWREKLAEQLVAANAELNSKRQTLDAAEDVLARTEIVAPMDGEVMNLAATTVGGVVRPGETIMEIVPASSGLVAAVKIPPTERAAVKVGQSVRTQLVAYKGWQAPRLTGEITGVSADLKVDPASNAAYFEARLLIPSEEAAKLGEAKSTPGMPIQVFIYSGARRTLFEQIGEPILESWFKGMRQS